MMSIEISILNLMLSVKSYISFSNCFILLFVV